MTWLAELTKAAQGHLDDRARDYLYTRGVSEGQMCLYSLGYLNKELPDCNYPSTFLDWSGKGSRLEDVIVLPLTNSMGDVRGFQFRSVSKTATSKSTHSPYMDFFDSEDEIVLFGLGQAMPHVWKTQSVYLVEGAFDLFPIQRGFPGVVATLTAKVPEALARLLRRLVSSIWLGWDADPTGRKMSKQFAKTHGREFEVIDIPYPRIPMVGTTKLTKDPGDLWETWGEIQFQEYLQSTLKTKNTELFDA